ncbi:GPP34 family phosphoprotein [Streptomyces sp. NPDC026673]|uniref:GPP34 family phosphoprotein n=1 Tax=Streptomyces sp. NPDC026673 TaxID=3155724 RepID=UPI0033F4D051
MTTPRDLTITALERAAERSVEPGDLSLALAAAEAIDLLPAGAVTLAGDRLVPAGHPAITDHLLAEAASALLREAPYETVGDWLWRRGRNLADTYLTRLEAEGELVREQRRRWLFLHSDHVVLADSPTRRGAAARLAADEPVLAALTRAIGFRGGPAADAAPDVTDRAAARVLTALDDALAELAAERKRRSHRQADAAAENVRRGY